MKKIYFASVAFVLFLAANAQVITFTSLNFKNKLLAADTTNQIAKDLNGNFFKVDADNDGQIDRSEALQVSYLDISNSTIFYMEGLQYFTNLVELYCHTNSSNTNILNVSMMPNLEILHCYASNLNTLNVNGLTRLRELRCSNGLTTVDFTSLSSLQILRCEGIGTPTLNLSGLSNLLELYCNNSSRLTSINFTGCTNLTKITTNLSGLTSLNLTGLNNLSYLECSQNPLGTLNASNLPALTYLQAVSSQLTSLDVSNCPNLRTLHCNNNVLTSLNLQNCTGLATVNMGINQLTSINLEDCINMTNLDCRYNQLTTLDTSNSPRLMYIYCLNNNLTSLFVKNGGYQTINFADNPNLSFICCDDDFSLGFTPGWGEVRYLENRVIELGIPNCTVNTYCSFVPGGTFYTVEGNTRFDMDGNGCDNNDIAIKSQRYNMSIGGYSAGFVSDTSGNYTTSVQAGNLSISPILEIPAYFNVSPTSVLIPFPATASPFTQNFCVTANGVHNDLEISLIPLTVARPGFDAFYKIIYRNKGTAAQSGTINLAFNDAVSDLISSTPAVSNQTTDNLSWNFSNLLPFESREITINLQLNTPTANPPLINGDILNYVATINGLTDETPADNTTSFNQILVGSFDPNDKTCVEGTIVAPSSVGEYVHYVIRFENTGTYSAENIVVKDVIDTNKFVMNSLVPLGGSASYVTRICNTNEVEFIFENINLPFDDANNDGYVSFKIKTKPTLVEGNTFSNSAKIYFDYNAPIVTDTYTTTIQSLGIPDFDFKSAFILSPVPAKESITITSKEEIKMNSISIYNILGQLIQVNTNPAKTIDISSLKAGTFLIKIYTDKGNTTAQFIKE